MRGSIPESFFGLTNLLVLGLDDNLLESPIAPFAKLNRIQKLYAEGKSIHSMQGPGLLLFVVFFLLLLSRYRRMVAFYAIFLILYEKDAQFQFF